MSPLSIYSIGGLKIISLSKQEKHLLILHVISILLTYKGDLEQNGRLPQNSERDLKKLKFISTFLQGQYMLIRIISNEMIKYENIQEIVLNDLLIFIRNVTAFRIEDRPRLQMIQ